VYLCIYACTCTQVRARVAREREDRRFRIDVLGLKRGHISQQHTALERGHISQQHTATRISQQHKRSWHAEAAIERDKHGEAGIERELR